MKVQIKKYKNGVRGRFETSNAEQRDKIEKALKALAKRHGCTKPDVVVFNAPLPTCGPDEAGC